MRLHQQIRRVRVALVVAAVVGSSVSAFGQTAQGSLAIALKAAAMQAATQPQDGPKIGRAHV